MTRNPFSQSVMGMMVCGFLLFAGTNPAEPNRPDSSEVVSDEAANILEAANLVIYRDTSYQDGSMAEVRVNGRKLAELGNKDWTAVRLDHGNVKVAVRLELLIGFESRSKNLMIESGELHFLELIPVRSRALGRDDGYELETILRIRGSQDPGLSEKILECCEFVEPDISWEATPAEPY